MPKFINTNKPFLIIVEGPDLAGKTTFVNYFSDTKFVKKHFGRMPLCKTKFDYYRHMKRELITLSDMACEQGKDAIIDRSWISDRMYKFLRDGYLRVTPTYNIKYNMLVSDLFRGVCTVVFLPSYDEIIERFKSRGDELLNLAQISEGYFNYKFMCDDIDIDNCIQKYGVPYSHKMVSDFIVIRSDADLLLFYDAIREYVNM